MSNARLLKSIIENTLCQVLSEGYWLQVGDKEYRHLAHKYVMRYTQPITEILLRRCTPEIQFNLVLFSVTQTLLSLHMDYFDHVFDEQLSRQKIIQRVEVAQIMLHKALPNLRTLNLEFTDVDWTEYRSYIKYEQSMLQDGHITFDSMIGKIVFMVVLPRKLCPALLRHSDINFYQDYLKLWLLIDDIEDVYTDRAEGRRTIATQTLQALRSSSSPAVEMQRHLGELAVHIIDRLNIYTTEHALHVTENILARMRCDLIEKYAYRSLDF